MITAEFFIFEMRMNHKKNIDSKPIRPFSSTPIHYHKLWSRYKGQAGWLMSANSTRNNLTRRYDVNENSWSSHFAVLIARVSGKN